MKYLIDFAVLAFLYFLAFFPRWKKQGRDRLLVNTLMYLYLSLVLFVTLMPILAALPFVFNHPYSPMNTIPFVDVFMGRGDFIRQVVLNVFMTVPFGFLFPLNGNRAGKFGRTVLCCILMSLGIELLQPLINGFRSADITDVITNAVGGVIGYGLYILCRPAVFWLLDRLKRQSLHG